MTIIQYDSVNIDNIPNYANSPSYGVAGYVGGIWPNESALVKRFPKARHKSIAINASEDADILDIENGDAVPSDAPTWFGRQKQRGLALPGFYADASTMPTVIAILKLHGIPRSAYVLWVAHLQTEPNAPFELGANAVQYTFNALNRDLDASVCLDTFWHQVAPPPVYNKPHYDWFPAGPFPFNKLRISERNTVQAYDKLRAIARPSVMQKTQLTIAKLHLRWLAARVNYVAKHPLKHNKPTWGFAHRGWRFQQLIQRSTGVRFI